MKAGTDLGGEWRGVEGEWIGWLATPIWTSKTNKKYINKGKLSIDPPPMYNCNQGIQLLVRGNHIQKLVAFQNGHHDCRRLLIVQ